MERSVPEAGGVLTTTPNGRKNRTQLAGSRRPQRKSSGNPESKENSVASDTDRGARAIPRPAQSSTGIPRHRHSESLAENRFAGVGPSPSVRVDRSAAVFGTPQHSRSTRIPRPAVTDSATESRHSGAPEHIHQHQNPPPNQSPDPSSPMRQPMNLRAAFKRAQEQAAAEETTDSENSIDLQQAFHMANAEFNAIRGIDGSPSPAPRSFRREFKSTTQAKNGAGVKKNDLNTHLERFDRNHQLTGRDGPLTGLFTKNRDKPMAVDTGQPLGGKTSGSSLDDKPGLKSLHIRTTNPRNHENIDGNATFAGRLPATDAISGRNGADIPVPSIENEHTSDDESSNFQPADISPEKSMNWHLDADFTAGDLQFSESPRITIRKPSSDLGRQIRTPISHQSNDRLDRIQQREIEAAKMTFAEDISAVKQINHKLDEIRIREMEALSRRAVASSRLDEIRLRNSESRSKSPETHKDLHKPLKEEPAQPHVGQRNTRKPSPYLESEGEPIRDTPIVVFKNSDAKNLDASAWDRNFENHGRRETLSRSDSHDLLRRLARATSSSPRENSKDAEQDKESDHIDKTEAKQLSEMRNLDPSLREGIARNPEVKNPKDRLTVGFADLRRIPSSNSIEEKRTSMPTSDVDPTDRIAAELNLFAPLDNYSEKGSIRAPSPAISEPVDEKTPRPPKIDPLTQPTPRVTGAYVDTPATVRVKGDNEDAVTRRQTFDLSPAEGIANPSAPDRARPLSGPGPRSSSVPTASRRSRSSSRRRRRPLINTARPPTVREDIISILRANNIDDSTLENLDSILADQEFDDRELKKMVNDTVLKVEDDLDVKFSEISDRERELEAYDRMSKSLQTGLLGIRSAKKGIERLEDKVAHKGSDDDQNHPKAGLGAKPLAQPTLSPNEAAPVFIPVPRFYRKNPTFKLTRLGLVTVCATIWYILECAFCYLYAGPEYICTPTVPCDWSPNEPYFPYTMPFMLDEWATGGKGRALTFKVGEGIGDILAEVSDWVTNTDFTQYDERYMDVWQRKRHRRRLRKHGLIPKWTEPIGYTARYPAWEAAKAAKEAAEEFGFDEDETMSADEIVR